MPSVAFPSAAATPGRSRIVVIAALFTAILFCQLCRQQLAAQSMPVGGDTSMPESRGFEMPEGWEEIIEPRAAFAVTMPSGVTRTISTDDRTFRRRLFRKVTSMRASSEGIEYVLRFSDYDPEDGWQMIDEPMFAHALQMAPQRFEGMERKVSRTTVQGVQAQDVTAWKADGGSKRSRFLIRGNRALLMLADVPGGGDTMKADRFLASIRFLDPTDVPWKRITLDSLGFSAMFPSDPIITKTSADEMRLNVENEDKLAFWSSYGADSVSKLRFAMEVLGFDRYTINSRDSAASLVYSVLMDEFNPYFTAELDTAAFFGALTGAFLGRWDSVISTRRFMLGRLPAEELVFRIGTGHMLCRTRSIISGMRCYHARLIAPESMLYTPQAERFFASVLPLDTMAGTDLFTDKLPLLFADLSSDDETARAEALEALPRLIFGLEDVPELITALQRTYPDDSSTDGARGRLLRELPIIADSSTMPVIAHSVIELMPTFDRSPALESMALRTLLYLRTPDISEIVMPRMPRLGMGSEAYDTVSARLFDNPRAAELLTDELLDVLSKPLIVVGRLPELFQHVGRTPSRTGLIALAEATLDNGKVELGSIEPYLPGLFDLSESLLAEARVRPVDPAMRAAGIKARTEVVKLLMRLPPSERGRALVRTLLDDPEVEIRRLALVPAFSYEEKIPDNLIAGLAADPTQRLGLFDQLSRIDSLKLMPERFRTGASLVEGSLISLGIKPSFVAEATAVSEDGREGRLYIFKATSGGESYAVVVGPVVEMSSFDIRFASIWYGPDEFDDSSLDMYVDSALAWVAEQAERYK